MNWYNELKQQEKTAGWLDMLKKKPGGMSGSPAMQPNQQFSTEPESQQTQDLKRQITQAEMDINRARREVQRNPQAKAQYDQAVQRKNMLLQQLEQLRSKEYSLK